jgi:hypothetical protein
MRNLVKKRMMALVFFVGSLLVRNVANAAEEIIQGSLLFQNGAFNVVDSGPTHQSHIVDLEKYRSGHTEDFLINFEGASGIFKIHGNGPKNELVSAAYEGGAKTLIIYPGGVEYSGELEKGDKANPEIKFEIPGKESLSLKLGGGLIFNYRLHSFANHLEESAQNDPELGLDRAILTGKITENDKFEVASIRQAVTIANTKTTSPAMATGILQRKNLYGKLTQYYLTLPIGEELWVQDNGKLAPYLGRDVALRGSIFNGRIQLDDLEGIFPVSDNLLDCARKLGKNLD